MTQLSQAERVNRDIRVSAIWRDAADGRCSLEAAQARVDELTGRRTPNNPTVAAGQVVDLFKSLPREGQEIVLARLVDASAPIPRKKRARPDEKQQARLAERKKLAAGILPDDLVGNLTVADQAVAAVLARACRMGICTMRIDTIARDARVSIRTAQYALRHLEDAKLIVCFQRRRAPKRNDTNQVAIASVAWRRHIWKMAGLRRLDRVQKTAPVEKKNKSSSYFTGKRLGEKELGGGTVQPPPGPTRQKRFVWLSPKTEAWLKCFRDAAGPTLNPSSLLLYDPGPITHWLALHGCTEADVFTGIASVRRRHEGSARTETIWCWDYFKSAVERARDLRLSARRAAA